MDELRLSLLIFGTCFIIAVLAHGIWKIRKNKKQTRKERIEPGQWNDDNYASSSDFDDEDADTHNYDDLGLGEVRVVSANKAHNPSAEGEPDTADMCVSGGEASEEKAEADAQQTAAEPVKLYGSVVSNPKPHIKSVRGGAAEQLDEEGIPGPPDFLIRKTHNDSEVTGPGDDFQLDPQSVPDEENTVDKEDSHENDSKRLLRNRSTSRRRQEPNIGVDQMNIDFDESQRSQGGAADEPSQDANTSEDGPEQEVLVLNVRCPDDHPISGAAMLPLLLTLGFKFGDQDIFHRHVNSNGKGPVLFSLANMFKPGVFDIDNLETFSTQGVSLFMILPIEGDAHQVFNMMHNAARKIAEEFNAQILDGRRSVLTKQGLQQYMEKIREFERRRMIPRS